MGLQVLAQVQRLDLCEQKWPKMLTQVQQLDLCEHLWGGRL